jgi:nucleoid-associated protein YgaU
VGPDGSKTGERIEAARQPGSAFTIVDADETLEDVARRIYGSGAVVDSLWRANRDALARSDSQLSAGTVLRTPVLVTQSPLRK